MDNSLSKNYLHGLIDEGTVAEIDEPEEEPVAHGQNTPRNTPKYQNNPKKWLKIQVFYTKYAYCTWSSKGQPRS